VADREHFSQEPLAVFGGTFDPVHYAHLRCGEQARQTLGLETLYLLPAGDPPHKKTPFTTAGQRLEMLRLAQVEFPTLDIDDRELRRDGPSFMADTLGELRAEHPRRPLLFLLGQDSLNKLHVWYQWRRIFELAHVVTFPRPRVEPDYAPELAREIDRRGSDPRTVLSSLAGGFLHLDLELIDISATAIQETLRRGASPSGMLPDSVLAYIDQNRLYRQD
jgi:nicotinate-nucleotide adenylyltransferase